MRTLLAKVTDHLNSGNVRLTRVETPEAQDMDIEKWDGLSRILDQVNRDGTV